MTHGLFGAAPGPINSEAWVRRTVAAHLKRQEADCLLILAHAYIEVARKLNGDRRKTFDLFDEFTKTVAKALAPKGGRGRANPARDARILAAGDAAPRGQKEVAIAAAAGATSLPEIEAARKRSNRLAKKRDAREKWLADVVAAVRRKMRLGSRRALFENTEPSPSPSPAEGTNT